MERKSRVNKYRELRESIKEDASLPKQTFDHKEDDIDDTPIPTLHEYRMKQMIEETRELDSVKENELDGVKEELESKEIEDAINRVRMTSGKGQQYNTRLDILNHIQAGSVQKVDETPLVTPVEDNEEEIVVEKEVENKTPQPATHFKIFYEDEEEKTEEDNLEATQTFDTFSFEKQEATYDEDAVMHSKSLFAGLADDEDEEEEDEEDIDIEEDEDEEEKTGIVEKVLTGLIVVLSICLVVLLIYIVTLFL